MSTTDALVSAGRKLAVALIVSMAAVVMLAVISVAIISQRAQDADSRAKRATAELAQFQASEGCRADKLEKIASVLVQQAKGLDDIVLALAARQPAQTTGLVTVQRQLAELEREGFAECLPPPLPDEPEPSTTTVPETSTTGG